MHNPPCHSGKCCSCINVNRASRQDNSLDFPLQMRIITIQTDSQIFGRSKVAPTGAQTIARRGGTSTRARSTRNMAERALGSRLPEGSRTTTLFDSYLFLHNCLCPPPSLPTTPRNGLATNLQCSVLIFVRSSTCETSMRATTPCTAPFV
jgi:hypothetical protein